MTRMSKTPGGRARRRYLHSAPDTHPRLATRKEEFLRDTILPTLDSADLHRILGDMEAEDNYLGETMIRAEIDRRAGGAG